MEVGGKVEEGVKDLNHDLERFFKICKSHERKIHGRQHTGIRLVVEGPTVIPTLDAHLLHPSQFSCNDLFPYSEMDSPPAQIAALARKKKQDWRVQEKRGDNSVKFWKAGMEETARKMEAE